MHYWGGGEGFQGQEKRNCFWFSWLANPHGIFEILIEFVKSMSRDRSAIWMYS